MLLNLAFWFDALSRVVLFVKSFILGVMAVAAAVWDAGAPEMQYR